MKIDIKGKDPYSEVIEIIRELTREDGYECMSDRIVRIRTTVLGEDNTYLGVDDNGYYWANDWYEGGEVELLGWIDVPKIRVQKLGDHGKLQGEM